MRPAFPLPPGGTLRRLVAFEVDQFIWAVFWLLLSSWVGAFYLSVSRWPEDPRSLAILAGLLAALGVSLHAIYWVVFVGGCGQTPGKMILDLAVISRDGSPVGYGRSACRWVGMAVAALPFGLGFLGVLVTRERRGLHDLLAGTRVVRATPLWEASQGEPGEGSVRLSEFADESPLL